MQITRRQIPITAPTFSATRLAARLVRLLLRWQERASERHHLSGLDDRMLKDIGVTRADIESEAGKPFWRG